MENATILAAEPRIKLNEFMALTNVFLLCNKNKRFLDNYKTAVSLRRYRDSVQNDTELVWIGDWGDIKNVLGRLKIKNNNNTGRREGWKRALNKGA